MRWLLLTMVLCAGCGNKTSPAPNGDDATARVDAPAADEPSPAGDEPASAEPPVAGEAPAPTPTPDAAPAPTGAKTSGDAPASGSVAALYAECRDRVEQPESDGECSTDADCARAGCSSEICTTTAAAADVMSTCEVRECYAVLDACGCVDGRCTWSLVDSAPKRAPKGVLR